MDYPPTNNSSIFPTFENQQSWKFAKSNNQLHLHDGNVIHHFSADHFKDDEDFPATKLSDASYFDFGMHMPMSGTAQVHKADPALLYVTLHDGEKNPTYTFTHVSEDKWRVSPKHKTKSADILQALDSGMNKATDAVRSLGNNPQNSFFGGLALGGIYDLGRRALYNSNEENLAESGMDRAVRWLAPATVAGGLGTVQRNLIPHHYDGGPMNRAGGLGPPNRIPGKDDGIIQSILGKQGSITVAGIL